jgi:hypothetical protein
MTERELRKAERKRLVRRIVAHIDEFPRQHEALEYSMEGFGAGFDLRQFKEAFEFFSLYRPWIEPFLD